MGVPSSHIAWALKKKAGKEHVLLPNFVRKFGFTAKDSANRAILKLISSNNLRQSHRVNLQRLLTEFQQNLEESFWSDYTLEFSTRSPPNRQPLLFKSRAQNRHKRSANVLSPFWIKTHRSKNTRMMTVVTGMWRRMARSQMNIIVVEVPAAAKLTETPTVKTRYLSK